MNCKLTLQEKLKDLRTERGLSLVELSEKTGISKSALGSYESDDTKNAITVNVIVTLAGFYGVTSAYWVLQKIVNAILSRLMNLA